LSGFGSTSNVRFFWFCSPVGGVGKLEACACRPQARRPDVNSVGKPDADYGITVTRPSLPFGITGLR
jgi:hypothetical protein